MSTLLTTQSLEVLECSCGGVYALTSGFLNEKRASGGTWPCPYCGGVWNQRGRESLQQKLDRERSRAAAAEGRAERARQAADHERARANGYKGYVTKVKKRVGRGVCPCCNRTFKDLAAHMETKHPEYAESTP